MHYLETNLNSTPDIPVLGYDIKTCTFKSLKNNGKNAKERLTLTNVGNTHNYDSFKHIVDCENFSECTYYKKSKRFILFVRGDDKIKNKTFYQLMNQPMLTILMFNIKTLPPIMKNIITTDYKKIRNCIIDKQVSQKGQQYLHIHPHGSGHGSGNRAFGFTSSFITQFVAFKLSKRYKKNIETLIIKKGTSISIKNRYL